MLALNLSALLALAYTAWALPLTIDTSSLILRSPPLSNAPLTPSEGLFDRRNTLAVRTPGIEAYVAPGTQTKVLIKAGWVASNMYKVLDLLRATIKFAKLRIAERGDGVVPITDLVALGSAMVGEGVHLTLTNANNHQLTYGVVLAAAMALSDFFAQSGGYQSVDFQIIDGKTLVGTGKIAA